MDVRKRLYPMSRAARISSLEKRLSLHKKVSGVCRRRLTVLEEAVILLWGRFCASEKRKVVL